MTAVEPGDLIFCYGRGAVAWGIRMAERFRRDWNDATEAAGDRFDHVAIVDRQLPDGDWSLIQALSNGVVADSPSAPSRLSHYDRYVAVKCPGDGARTVAFATAQVGAKYGFVTIASILVTLLTPRFLNVMLPGTWICSAVGAECLRFGGWLHNWPDLYDVSPAELFVALQ